MTELPPAVLTGGENIAVSAARSLGRSGVRVHALGAARDPVRHSRYCHEFVEVEPGTGVGGSYLSWLESEGPRGAAILPCDDVGLDLVARHRARLEELGYLPIEANDEVLATMLDKARTYELCGKLGIPAPRTATVRTRADAEEAARMFQYPCALKPVNSHRFAQHFGTLNKLVEVHSPEELLTAFERTLELGIDMLATEVVPGADDQFHSYYSYLDEDGRPLFHFTKHKLRQWPIHYGITCYHATIWDPEVAELGLRFFQGAGLRGVGNVEFKRDARDGAWTLIECNHRFTAANDLVRAAGIDVPLLAYNRLVGRPPPPLSRYRRGLHMWHPVEDLRALRDYRAAGELSVAAWLRSLRGRQRFPLLDPDDPMPSLVKIGERATNLARKATGRRSPAFGVRPGAVQALRTESPAPEDTRAAAGA